MRFFTAIIISLFSTLARSNESCALQQAKNSCVTFSVSSGTGCAWMCNYCANALGTNNYYFVDGVCQYQTGGCVGNPQVGVQYTCCAV
jgi:hypothetical protein